MIYRSNVSEKFYDKNSRATNALLLINSTAAPATLGPALNSGSSFKIIKEKNPFGSVNKLKSFDR